MQSVKIENPAKYSGGHLVVEYMFCILSLKASCTLTFFLNSAARVKVFRGSSMPSKTNG